MSTETLARDLRYAVRRMARDWRFTAAAVLILGLAIGANTAIFSVVNAVLFRTEAYPDAERLVNIYQNDRAGQPLVVTSYDAYTAIAAHTDLFAGTMAASIPGTTRYLDGSVVRPAIVEYATASYLEVLGLRPSRGRWFEPSEERRGAPGVAVLGYQTWNRRFGADPSVIGRVIRIEGAPVTIVGVGPAGHRATVDIGVGTDLWRPITALPESEIPGKRGAFTIFAPLLVKARLRDGVSIAQARAVMDTLGRRLAAENPEEYRQGGEFVPGEGITVLASSDVRIHPQADRLVTALASLLFVVVGLVLAIACSNLATLLLVRGGARAKEISVRIAVGASRGQIVRTLLTESVLLSIAGGAGGCLLAWWGVQALRAVDLPVMVDLRLDYRVLLFALGLSLVTGIAFGLAPALKATRVDLVKMLRDEGLPPIDQRRLTLKNALIVMQVAVSVLLLGGTSIFLQMAAAARALQVGFAVDGVAFIETDSRFAGYPDDRARNAFDELLRRIQAIPAVQAAALMRGLPMDPGSVVVVTDSAEDPSDPGAEAATLAAGPGFFETLQIPLLYGRAFDTRDRADTPRVAVITERMARQHFGQVNAVGRRFRRANDPGVWFEVIGIVPDTGTGDIGDDVLDPIAPPFYTSYLQSGALPTTVIARTAGDANALVAAMQRELRALDAALPVITAQTMAQRLEESHRPPEAVAAFLGALGGLGLVLASIGLYAVISFAVARRTREIGIRMALGARGPQVVWSIARGVAALVAVGTAIGLGFTLLVVFVLGGGSGDVGIGNIAFLAFHPRIDPVALLSIAVITAAVGVAAAFVPGRRAASMNPLTALRHE